MVRHLRAFPGVALTLLLGVMPIATIYFTLFEPQWIAFLAGANRASVVRAVARGLWYVILADRLQCA